MEAKSTSVVGGFISIELKSKEKADWTKKCRKWWLEIAQNKGASAGAVYFRQMSSFSFGLKAVRLIPPSSRRVVQGEQAW